MSAEEDVLAEARRRWLNDAEFHARVHDAAELVRAAYEKQSDVLREFMPEILPVLREAAAVALVLQDHQSREGIAPTGEWIRVIEVSP